MKLAPSEAADWPKLTWAASVREDQPAVLLQHGPQVEVRENWAIEGVWAGAFEKGDFDRTALVFGSGVRCRDDSLTFVSAGSNVDRLWHTRGGELLHVSNSLPALLAVSGLRLSDAVPDYPARVCSLLTTVGTGTVEIPAEDGSISCTYHHNLRWNGEVIRPVVKPSTAPVFASYGDYRNFLLEAAAEIGANATATERDRPMRLLTTVTGGYDSAAAAVVAREAGCEQAATIRSARSVVPRSDSGREVAQSLGLSCSEHPRGGRDHPNEVTFWAATGNVGDANLAVFDYGAEPCLLFTGIAGGRFYTLDQTDVGFGLLRGDWNGLGLSEFRLHQGVVHFPVPFCGARRAQEIFQLSHATEMSSWILGGDYDRPLPRRIAEEAGVPREAFGMKKSATMYDESFLWPRRPDLRRSYRAYLEGRGSVVPPVALGRLLDRIERKLWFPLRNRVMNSASQARLWPSSRKLLFPWANHEIVSELKAAVHDWGGSDPPPG